MKVTTGGRGRAATGICLCVAALLAPLPVAGQTAVSFGGGFGGFAGSDFAGTPAGLTMGGALHLAMEGHPAEVSFGIDHSSYGGHGFVGATRQLDYSAALRMQVAARPALVAGIRFGYSTRSLSVVEEPARTEGMIVGPTLSLRVPTGLGPFVETSLDALYVSYEELIMHGGREYGTDQDGFRGVLRVGVWMPLGDG
ncbi:MAG: hypothetical protein WEA34_14375 [Gemmatimonadota bacterium]